MKWEQDGAMPTYAERTRLSRVLVVEDHPHQLRTLTELLEAEGVEVIGTSTGAEALAALEREEVGIVIVDLHLPDQTGTALLEQLRARSETTRIIIYTGYGSFATAKDAVNIGAFAYVEKGGDPAELIGHVRRAREMNLSRYADALEAVVAQRTAELERRFIELRNLHDLVSRLNSAASPGEIYNAALDALNQTLQPDRASILLFDPDGVMRFKAWRGLSAEYRRAVEGHSPWKQETGDAQPILISDAAEDGGLGPYRSAILQEGIRAMAFIPLISQERVIGKFMLYADAPHQWTNEEVRLAQTIAAHVAFAIERHRAEAELRRSYEEREQICHDLHDGVLQSIYAIGLTVETIRQEAGRTSPSMGSRLDEVTRRLNGIIHEIRDFITRPPVSSGRATSLIHELQSVLESFRASSIADIEVRLDASVAASFSSEQSVHLIHIVKEALSNSVRHAEAAHRSVILRRFRGGIRLEVRDDGVGFRVHQRQGAGMGLSTMRARAKKLGGRLTILSRPRCGTRVVLDLPPIPAAGQHT